MIQTRPQVSASAPCALEALAPSERFVLWNFRAWACCCRGRRLPAGPVVAALADIGAPAAAEALDAAMTRLVLAAGRPLAVHCPPHPALSEDELALLAAAAAAQRHDRGAMAELFADLLSPPASALVGRSLTAFGAAIAMAGVLLPQPGPGRQPAADVGASGGWPAATPGTLH